MPISELYMPEHRPIIKALSEHRKAGTVTETVPAILIQIGQKSGRIQPRSFLVALASDAGQYKFFQYGVGGLAQALTVGLKCFGLVFLYPAGKTCNVLFLILGRCLLLCFRGCHIWYHILSGNIIHHSNMINHIQFARKYMVNLCETFHLDIWLTIDYDEITQELQGEAQAPMKGSEEIGRNDQCRIDGLA